MTSTHDSHVHLRPETSTSEPMNPNHALWERGDFTRIASTMRDSGEALVKELAITNGLEDMDLDAATELLRCPPRVSAPMRPGSS
jgi:hypothetical protein